MLPELVLRTLALLAPRFGCRFLIKLGVALLLSVTALSLINLVEGLVEKLVMAVRLVALVAVETLASRG